MSRSVMLHVIYEKYTYHHLPDIELIERKEDENTIIQGDHVVYVLPEFESIVWEKIDGSNSVKDIINVLFDYLNRNSDEKYDFENVEDEVCKLMSKFINEDLIHSSKEK